MKPTLLDIQVTTPATNRAVLVSETKKQLEIADENGEHDEYLDGLLTAAHDAVAHLCGRSLLTQTVTIDYTAGDLSGFPLLRPPFQSLTSVTSRFEGTDTAETLDDFYVRRGLIPVVRRKHDALAWNASRIDEVRLVYDAGYGAQPGDVPEAARLAIKQAVAGWFEQRTPIEVGHVVARTLPGDAKRTLLDSGLVIPTV